MSCFGAFKRALLVRTDVSLMVFLFWKAVFGFLATIGLRSYWAFHFIIFTFNWTKAITKLNMIPIKSFVNTDVVL